MNRLTNSSGSNSRQFEKDIDIKKLFNIIKNRLWIVIICTMISTLLGGIYSYKYTPPIYQSSARYILQGADEGQIGTFNEIIKDPFILDKVIKELHLNTTSDSLKGQISLITNSQVVTITVAGSSPILTGRIANTTIRTFKNELPNLTGFNGVIILSEAEIQNNSTPINQGHLKTIFISSILGLVLGIGLVFFVNSLDDTFKSESEIEILLGLQVLGSISKVRKFSIKKKQKINQNISVRGESYEAK